MHTHANWPRQEELERLSQAMGLDRYKRRLSIAAERNDPASAGAANSLLTRMLNPTIAAIEEFLARASDNSVGRRHRAADHLKGVEVGTLAYATVRTVLNSCSMKSSPLTRTAKQLGLLVEAEARLTAFAVTNKASLADWIANLDERTSSPDWRRTVLVHQLNKRGDNWPGWDDQTKVRVGLALIECFINSTDVAEINTYATHGKTVSEIRLTAQARAWIGSADNYRALLSPAHLPCVIPPKPWTDTVSGGYYMETAGHPMSLLKAGPEHHIQPATELVDVMASVNHLQNTAWRVHPRILSTLQEVWEKGLDVPSLPKREPAPLPAKPADINTNDEALTNWKRAAMQVHQANALSVSKRLAVAYTLNVATTVEHDPAIYFPYQLDFRGRAYAIPMWLNPQGPDYAKALLTFAEGKPIGNDTGPGWLAIHGANCFGADKITLEQRIDWVEENQQLIRSVASDPLQCMWWTEASKPWQFLAFCFEWADYCTATDAGTGPAFMSSLPVMVDGTCNGLQHYSAMLRDPIGGAATNLVPSNQPQDIYGLVAERVMETLRFNSERDDDGDHLMAYKWLTLGIDRKMTKRPVMVLPYGGTQHSCTSYVWDAVSERGIEATKAEVKYLSAIVWSSIGDVVVSAREAMSWLRTTALLLTKNGIAPQWRTPMGLIVKQIYNETKSTQLVTYLFGKRFKPRLEIETDTLDPRRSSNGLPPNFVHSLDAAALQATVMLANGNGVTAFAAVHDAYGTHASDMHTLAACLRHSFVELYEDHDTLGDFRAWCLTVLPADEAAKVPPLPAKGTLDLPLVKESDFFFA